jgi:hypothetical protein
VNHHRPDPWKAVATRCKFLLGTASDHRDVRGSFVGIALRPPPEGDACPTAMKLAMETEEFGLELVALLARWRILQ